MVGKVIIIGDSGVGKTTILTQFVHEIYHDNHDLTIGVDFGSKYVDVDGVDVKLQIWDTAGQENFRSISRSYYKGAEVAIIVFDSRSLNYLDKVNSWINDLHVHNDDVKIIIVGNKKDMLSTIQQTSKFNQIKKLNYPFYLISSKNYNEVEKVFVHAAQFIYEYHKYEDRKYNLHVIPIKVSVWNKLRSTFKMCWD